VGTEPPPAAGKVATRKESWGRRSPLGWGAGRREADHDSGDGEGTCCRCEAECGSRAVSEKRWSRGMGVHALATGKPSVVPATWKALTVAVKTDAGVGAPGGGGGGGGHARRPRTGAGDGEGGKGWLVGFHGRRHQGSLLARVLEVIMRCFYQAIRKLYLSRKPIFLVIPYYRLN
jgi:hypothetical protein